MNIKIKNVKGGEKTISVEGSLKISELKSLVEAEFNVPPAFQKLILKGRILDDSKSLSDYSIKGTDTIILASTYTGAEKKPEPAPKSPEPEIIHQASNREERKSDERNMQTRNVNRGTFNFLVGNPQFEQILAIIRENPRAFEDFIVQLESANPELFDLIVKNKAEFVELIRGRETGSGEVQLTKEEFADVKELMALGFSAQDSLDAYLGCGRNKEMAANLLFSNFS